MECEYSYLECPHCGEECYPERHIDLSEEREKKVIEYPCEHCGKVFKFSFAITKEFAFYEEEE